ncbi:MAG: hypothetical protein Q3962_07905, partial [Corynebacterium sp.]|nr:hypothetical protein [Corynebacterium sp.]
MRTLGTIIAALGIAMGLSMSISPSPASFAADAAYEKPYVKEGTYTDKALIPVTGLGPLAQT